MRKLIGIVSAATALLLVGCAGNVDESSENAADDGPGEHVAEDSQELAYCYYDAAENQAFKNFEAAAIAEMNKRRAAGATCPSGYKPPTTPLTANASLHCAALVHSLDMAQNNYFSHTGFDGSTPSQRVVKAGYTGTYMAEAIAGGQPTPVAVVDAWIKSPGHCDGVMNSTFKTVGIGYFYSDIPQYKHYWTTDFGK